MRLGLSTLYALLLGGLAACQSAVVPDTASPYYTIPAGSSLTLRQPLAIPAGRAGVYLQGGLAFGQMQQFNGPQIQAYSPHCRFEVNDISDSARAIAPDTFMVTRVRHEVSYIEAARGVIAVDMDSGSAPAEIYTTLMDLHSDKQPQVRRLRCAHYQYPPVFARHLSIDEIRTALGQVATLQLPGNVQPR